MACAALQLSRMMLQTCQSKVRLPSQVPGGVLPLAISKQRFSKVYLREAQGLKLYSDMGVADDPDALTLAAVTQRVKDEYPDDYSNGRIMKRDVDVLQACLKCFHSLVKSSEIERSRLSERLPFKFYYLDEDDKIEDVSALVSCL